MWFYLFLLTFILLIISVYANWNADRKSGLYEEWAEDTVLKIQNTLSEMQEIDEGGAFQSDDEVGDIFEELLAAAENLQTIEYNI